MLRRLIPLARVIQVPPVRQFAQNVGPKIKANGLLLSDSCVKRLQLINEGVDTNSRQYLRVLVRKQ